VNRLEDLERKIATREARVGVVGLGYVGLPLALAFTRAGFRVCGVDHDAARISELRAGTSYVGDVPSSEVTKALASGRFEPSTSYAALAEVDCIHICVPTPLTKTKDPDVSFIVDAVRAVRRHLHGGQLVVLGSTTYPGTTHEIYRPILEEGSLRCGHDFWLAFAPERIDPANREYPLERVPKVVGGETRDCTRLASALFGAVFEAVVAVSSSQAAEMVKLLENTFRMINVGLVNEVAIMCDRLDLDVWEVIEAAASKPFGFMKFLPGPGLGGHCIPIDPNYLAWKLRGLNYNARFIELASEINTSMPGWVIERVSRILNRERLAVNGSRILILGMAYKADVSDSRESPALDILAGLTQLGAQVSYHDRWIPEIRVDGRSWESSELDDAALRQSDLVLIATAHADVDYARVVRLASHVLDCRNATGPLGAAANVEKL
jgi:UDP-N-acetyl-D-glucosamine dehydrogenase